MTSKAVRWICRVLMVSMLLLPLQSVQAGMISAGRVAAPAQTSADRELLLSALNRDEVAGQLQSMGVDPSTARQRVAAMTDQEVQSLHGNIQSLPAGAWGNGWQWATLILIAVIVAYNWK